jgi:hypothetical protein
MNEAMLVKEGLNSGVVTYCSMGVEKLKWVERVI